MFTGIFILRKVKRKRILKKEHSERTLKLKNASAVCLSVPQVSGSPKNHYFNQKREDVGHHHLKMINEQYLDQNHLVYRIV